MQFDLDVLYRKFLESNGVSTDTRSLLPGQIFAALRGPHFNGNAFVEMALEKGAGFVLADDVAWLNHPRVMVAPNALAALQQLAMHHRKQFSFPVLAITGSNGKTTSKELIHAVLSKEYSTCTTQGNLNNHIGVPLTLLRLNATHEMAVIEMGANHQREIAGYCLYTLPTHGMITNVGKAHLEGFGGLEGVKKGKGELFDHLRSHQGIVFACSDFDYFREMAAGIDQVYWYGTNAGVVIGEASTVDSYLHVTVKKGFQAPGAIHTRLVGDYNVHNVLAAVCIGLHFQVAETDIVEAIEAYEPTNNRSQLVALNGNQVVLDAYNANPTSMAAAIQNFAGLPYPHKILFIGGMAELGEESVAEHKSIVDLIGKYAWKQVVLVGGDFDKTPHPYLYFANADAALAWWKENFSRDNCLLVKGSRSMTMEKLLEAGKEE
jgi:UDP-N-acetylmuramoyl-tripeptide--D-alanyl-D-alanine ligase